MIDLEKLSSELKEKLPKMTIDEVRRSREIYNNIVKAECEDSLAQFVKSSWHIIEPGTTLVWNWHLDVVCAYLEEVYKGNIKRLIINVPPGSMKSSIVSVCFPVWVWIKDATHKFLGIANEQGLALRDALKAKNIIEDDWFQEKWPMGFNKSQNEKMLYLNDKRGYRQSLGITGKITGKRGDTLLIDDPHDATEVESELQRQSVINIYDSKISTRLNHPKDSAIVLIMQRLNQLDLTGHLLAKKKTKWIQLIIPMEYEGTPRFNPGRDIGRPDLADPRKKDGELFFPKRFNEESVESLKEDLSEYGAAGQLQQRPSPKGGGILKRHWWKLWPDDKPLPKCEHVFASWDTAYSEKDLKNNSYSAMTKWGVFWHEQKQAWALLLLSAWDGQVDYPDLREHANKIEEEDQPDCQLIEKKASGQSLVQDLRRSGAMVRTYNPDRDKIARAYSVQAMLKSGLIYAPNRRWADKVIDMLAVFPNGASPSSDYTDTCTQAWIYLREGLWIDHPDDEKFEENNEESEREAAYG